MKPLGTVITTESGPSVSAFSFVIHSGDVKRGQFISVETEEGILLGNVTNIYKTNRYFESAGAVKEYTSKDSDLFSAFPVKEWEYTLADVHALGVYDKAGMLNRPSFPPSPGAVVNEIKIEILNKFLGLDQERGLHLGEIQQHKLAAKFNLTKMLQKHLAVLAISGAGKSYAVAVLLEELLSRQPEQGRVALLAVDTHGEYISIGKDPAFKNKVQVISGEDVKIATASMSEKAFAAILPKMTHAQVRDLGKILVAVREKFRGSKIAYDLNDIMMQIEADEDISKATKEALLGWLHDLKSMNVFSNADYPNVRGLLKAGELVVINFREILDLRRKQLVVNHISRHLFDLRKQGLCPPYLEIIEEAHNFCPETAKKEEALSRSIINMLAREGRKFYANICLISQRPVQLSTTALSQCNTQIILKVTNPYDLDHIKKSSEAISSSTLDIISSLKVGEALIIGEATNYPVFIKVRPRRSKEEHGQKLEDYAILYEKKFGKLAEGKDFI